MIYLTGDTHGDLERVVQFAHNHNLREDDVIIILGDVGLNYYGGAKDDSHKFALQHSMFATIFCVHGNHEMNPEYMNMQTKEWKGGIVYYEPEYENIIYAKDGEIYDFDGHKTIVLGGAYSVDKFYRISHGWQWFKDEQMSDDVKSRCMSNLEKHDWNIDVVLSHTVPFDYMPVDVFLSQIDQSTVDKSMEEWLQFIHDKLTFKRWYAGHYHCNRTVDAVSILFEDWMSLDVEYEEF